MNLSSITVKPLGLMKGVCLPIHTHTNPRGRLKWPSAVTRLTPHFMCALVSDRMICKLKEYDIIYDAKCPF